MPSRFRIAQPTFFGSRVTLALAALLALAACGQSAPPTPSEQGFSGTLTLNLAGSSLGLPLMPGATALPANQPLAYVPGEVLVKFRSTSGATAARTLSVGGVQLQGGRNLGLDGARLFTAQASSAQGSGSVPALVQSLRARADVEWAQPNYLMYAFVTPNDKAYGYQWHLPAINLPEAWDVETGSSHPVTVAVVDTGILSQHPDLVGKLLPGYDFISNPQNAADGDGRDANPEDAGDQPGGQSSYHGSHVAGTIAATTNNSEGVAGVSWGAKILPVRVLGVQGGALSDILDGILWAAGIDVPGAPHNPNPAQVINLSLGGEAACADLPAYSDAFQQVNAKGAIVVVAAGNSNKDAANFVPASCPGVITVGATQFSNQRARYSNFGARVDVMAPGGDVQADLNNDGYPDGVLSLGKDDQTGNYTYVFENGTSMASPHVAGLVALLKSKQPSLGYSEALNLLKQTGRPLSAEACTGQGPTQTPEMCGAGLVDAAAALKALSGNGGGNPNPTPQPDFSLSLNPNSLSLKPGGSTSVKLEFAASGGFNAALNLSLSGLPNGVNASFNNATLNLVSATTATPGNYGLTVTATGGGKTHSATLSLRVENPNAERPTLKNTVLLACYYSRNRDDCDADKSQVVTISSAVRSTAFRFKDLAKGQYLLLAWNDTNANTEVDSGDWAGVYTENGNLVLLEPPRVNLGLSLELVQSTSAVTSARVSPRLWRSLERSAIRQSAQR